MNHTATNLPVSILNTSIATVDGTYVLQTITRERAMELVRQPQGILSAVGHAPTAQMLSTLLGIEIPVNRILFEQQPDRPPWSSSSAGGRPRARSCPSRTWRRSGTTSSC